MNRSQAAAVCTGGFLSAAELAPIVEGSSPGVQTTPLLPEDYWMIPVGPQNSLRVRNDCVTVTTIVTESASARVICYTINGGGSTFPIAETCTP